MNKYEDIKKAKEITFQDIERANKNLQSTDIKGKSYIEVNQRIKAFRMLYPQGSIETELINNENGVCIFKATVKNEEEKILATGTAYEKENSSFINKTSYIENCETSAVGRALGMLGIGIDTSVASFEEVANAIQQQDEDKIISKTQINALKTSIENNMLDVNGTDKEVLSRFGYKDITEIKIKDYMKIVQEFQKLVK